MAGAVNVVRELVARLGIDVDQKSADRADSFLESLVEKAKALVAIAAGVQFARWVAGVIEEADKLNDAAERIGTTTAALQGLGFAAKLAGSDSDTLGQGLKFLTKTMAEADGGSKEAKKAFSALGVSIHGQDGKLKSSDALFLEIADSISKVENPTKRAALSMGVFSRAGQELAPLLSKGAAGIAEMRAEFKALGGEFDPEMVQQSAEFADNQDRLSAAFKGIGATIARAVLPAINRLVKSVLEFWKANGPLIRGQLEKAFQAVGTAIQYVGQLLEPIVLGVLGLVSAWEDLSTPVQMMIAGLGIILGLVFGILSPWLLIAAVIALVAEDIYTFSTGGESVIGSLVDKLFEFATSGDTIFHKFLAMFLDIVTTLRDKGLGGLWDEWGVMLRTAVNYYKDLFVDFVTTIKLYISTLMAWIPNKIQEGLAKAKAFLGLDANVTAEGQASSPFAQAAEAFTSPFATQSVTAAPRGGGPSVNATNTTQVTVNATPGMDEQALANATAEAVAAAMQEEKNALYSAIIPAVR